MHARVVPERDSSESDSFQSPISPLASMGDGFGALSAKPRAALKNPRRQSLNEMMMQQQQNAMDASGSAYDDQDDDNRSADGRSVGRNAEIGVLYRSFDQGGIRIDRSMDRSGGGGRGGSFDQGGIRIDRNMDRSGGGVRGGSLAVDGLGEQSIVPKKKQRPTLSTRLSMGHEDFENDMNSDNRSLKSTKTDRPSHSTDRVSDTTADGMDGQRHDSCMLYPTSGYRISWDLLVLSLLGFLFVTVPLGLAFGSRFEDQMILVDLIIDCLFLFDVVLNFRTAYDDGSGLVTDYRKVAYRYITGWCFIDIISCPSVIFAGFASVASDFTAFKLLKGAKALKVLKMVKVLKVFRVKQLLGRHALEVEVLMMRGTTQVKLKLLNLLLLVGVAGHWLACLWLMVSYTSPGMSSWMNSYRDGGAGDVEDDDDEVKYFVDWPMWDQYVGAFYFAVTTMTTVGYGDIVPSCTGERMFMIVAMIFGGGLYGFVIASLASVVSSLDTNQKTYYDKMDTLHSYMAYRHFPYKLRHRVHHYFRKLYEMNSALDEKSILEDLPENLRNDVMVLIVNDAVVSNYLFRDMPKRAVSKLASVFKPSEIDGSFGAVVRRGEWGSIMFVITGGTAQCYRQRSLEETVSAASAAAALLTKSAASIKVEKKGRSNSFRGMLRSASRNESKADDDDTTKSANNGGVNGNGGIKGDSSGCSATGGGDSSSSSSSGEVQVARGGPSRVGGPGGGGGGGGQGGGGGMKMSIDHHGSIDHSLDEDGDLGQLHCELEAGDSFGELVALGLEDRYNATVIASRGSVLELLVATTTDIYAAFADDEEVWRSLRQLAKDHSIRPPFTPAQLAARARKRRRSQVVSATHTALPFGDNGSGLGAFDKESLAATMPASAGLQQQLRLLQAGPLLSKHRRRASNSNNTTSNSNVNQRSHSSSSRTGSAAAAAAAASLGDGKSQIVGLDDTGSGSGEKGTPGAAAAATAAAGVEVAPEKSFGARMLGSIDSLVGTSFAQRATPSPPLTATTTTAPTTTAPLSPPSPSSPTVTPPPSHGKQQADQKVIKESRTNTTAISANNSATAVSTTEPGAKQQQQKFGAAPLSSIHQREGGGKAGGRESDSTSFECVDLPAAPVRRVEEEEGGGGADSDKGTSLDNGASNGAVEKKWASRSHSRNRSYSDNGGGGSGGGDSGGGKGDNHTDNNIGSDSRVLNLIDSAFEKMQKETLGKLEQSELSLARLEQATAAQASRHAADMASLKDLLLQSLQQQTQMQQQMAQMQKQQQQQQQVLSASSIAAAAAAVASGESTELAT